MKKIKLFTLLLLCSCFSIGVFAQVPNIFWQKTYGGTNNEGGGNLYPTQDGGYVVGGWSLSNDGDVTGAHGNYDYWLIKINSSGTLQWQKSYGGTVDDIGYPIRPTPDGGYILAGYAASNNGDVSGNHGNRDYWVVKVDSLGVIEWQKCYGGTGPDECRTLALTSDGGYILTGLTSSNNGQVTGFHGNRDAWVVKIDNLGNLQWQKSLGGTGDDRAYSIQQTTDGGYIMLGETGSNNGDVSGNHSTGTAYDWWLVKLDNSGNISWQKCLGGVASDEGRYVQQTADGGYILTGATASNNSGDVGPNHGGAWDAWVVKTDNLGAIQWQKVLGGSVFDRGGVVKPTSDGGYILTGLSNSNNGDVSGVHGSRDWWIVKLTSLGVIDWTKAIGGSGNDGAGNVLEIPNGYVISGTTESNDFDVTGNHGLADIWTVKLLSCIDPDVPTVSAGTNPICNGSSTTLSITSGNLNDATTWQWYSGSCGGTPVGTGTSVNVSPGSTTTYYVRGEGGCVTPATCASITVIVDNPLNNTIGALTGPLHACNGTIANVSTNPVPGATAYLFDGPAGTTFDGSNPSVYSTPSNSAAVTFGPLVTYSGYTICMRAQNSCGNSSKRCIWVRGTLSAPQPITGSTVACSNTSGSYSISPVGGATSYTWTTIGDMTVSGTGTSVTVNFGATFSSGTLCVAGNTPCTTGPQRCLTISDATANPGAITGVKNVCRNQSYIYSVPSVIGALTYNWQIPNNSTGSSTTNSINVTFGNAFNFGDIKVNITSICGRLSAVTQARTLLWGNCLANESNDLRSSSFVEKREGLIVYPNPAHDILNVTINSKQEANYTMELLDITGRVIISMNGSMQEGINSNEMSVKNFAKGVYLLSLKSGDNVLQQRVVIE